MYSRTQRQLVAAVVWTVMTTAAFPASAQQEVDPANVDLPAPEVLGEEGWMLSTSSTGMTLTGALGIYIFELGSADLAAVRTYLSRHGRGLQRDLHLGAGERLRDLAALFGVADGNFEAFGQVLFERREALTELAEPGGVDRSTARKFVNVVVDGMLKHGELSVDGDPDDP